MEAKLFKQLMDSMREMDEIVRGLRKPSRVFRFSPLEVATIRNSAKRGIKAKSKAR